MSPSEVVVRMIATAFVFACTWGGLQFAAAWRERPIVYRDEWGDLHTFRGDEG